MSLKMYVLIKSDLTTAQQAVQAGHALAQFGLEYPTAFREWQEDNNTLIYLSVDSIAYWKQVLEDGDFEHSVFHEPELPVFGRTTEYLFWNFEGWTTIEADTAIAVAPNWACQYLLFKDLPLALRPEKRKWWQR